MEVIARSPMDGICPATDDYVNAVEVRGAQWTRYVSGTMGLDPAGKAGDTLTGQLRLVWTTSG